MTKNELITALAPFNDNDDVIVSFNAEPITNQISGMGMVMFDIAEVDNGWKESGVIDLALGELIPS